MKNSKEATISDLKDVNGILLKVREHESRVKYEHIGDKDNLMIVGIGDTSLKTGDKAIGGVILFLTNSLMTRASPIYWKAKQIDRVCHSSKDAETLNLLTMAEDSVYAANQLDAVWRHLEEDPYLSVYRLQVNVRVCSIFKADCYKDFEDSHHGLEGEVIEWRDNFNCMASY